MILEHRNSFGSSSTTRVDVRKAARVPLAYLDGIGAFTRPGFRGLFNGGLFES